MILYVLAVLLVATIIAASYVGFQFFVFSASYYSVTTKRRFTEVIFNSFYRSSYRLGQKVEKIIRKQTGWILFDLSISQPSDNPAKDQLPNLTIDSIAIAEFGVIAMFWQDYTGKIVSQTNEDNWTVFENSKDDSPSQLIPNPATAVEKIIALLLELFVSENLDIKQIVPVLVFRNKCDISDIELKDGIRKVNYGRLTQEILQIQQKQGMIYSKDECLSTTRALVLYANSVIANPDINKQRRKDVITLTHDFINRKSPTTTNAEFMRKAYRLSAAKEDLEAITWQRIIEISQELETECSKERQVILSTELQQIAHTNIALNYSFGASETPFNAILSQKESEQHTLALNSPSLGTVKTMQTALDTSDFFEA